MKIVLAALNAKYVHSNLAVYDLEAYANKHLNGDSLEEKQDKSENIQLVVKEYTINHNLDMILQSLYQEKAEVVAFSCYIWNIREILTIAKELKKVAPDTRIWMGGPEVSYDSKKLLEDNPFLDVIMQGEGEITFYELVKELSRFSVKCNDGSMYQEILGIVYRKPSGEICGNNRRSLMPLDEVHLSIRIYHGLKIKFSIMKQAEAVRFPAAIVCPLLTRACAFAALTL